MCMPTSKENGELWLDCTATGDLKVRFFELKQTTANETAFPRYAGLACWKGCPARLHPAGPRALSCSVSREREPGVSDRDVNDLLDRGLKCLKQGAGETTHCAWQTAGRTRHGSNLHYLRRRVYHLRGTDARWAHQEPETNEEDWIVLWVKWGEVKQGMYRNQENSHPEWANRSVANVNLRLWPKTSDDHQCPWSW